VMNLEIGEGWFGNWLGRVVVGRECDCWLCAWLRPCVCV